MKPRLSLLRCFASSGLDLPLSLSMHNSSEVLFPSFSPSASWAIVSSP